MESGECMQLMGHWKVSASIGSVGRGMDGAESLSIKVSLLGTIMDSFGMGQSCLRKRGASEVRSID